MPREESNALSRAADLKETTSHHPLSPHSWSVFYLFPLTHPQCTGSARRGRQMPPASCCSKAFPSALSEMEFPSPVPSYLCSNRRVCNLCVRDLVWTCACLYDVCLLLSLSRLLSRLRSCCRNPELGQMSLWDLTAATASCSCRPSQIIKKASTNVAERLTPIRQWTRTRPRTETGAVDVWPQTSDREYHTHCVVWMTRLLRPAQLWCISLSGKKMDWG